MFHYEEQLMLMACISCPVASAAGEWQTSRIERRCDKIKLQTSQGEVRKREAQQGFIVPINMEGYLFMMHSPYNSC